MSAIERIADVEVLDCEERRIRLGTVWESHTVVLTFLRHFGCIFCREQALSLHRLLPRIRDLRGDLVFVGNGSPYFAQAFREDLKIDAPIFVDPEQKAYAAAGLKRGIHTSLTPKVISNAVRAMRRGSRQQKTQGDVWQQGGVFVIGPGNREHFRHVSRVAGDHPEDRDILTALAFASHEIKHEDDRYVRNSAI